MVMIREIPTAPRKLTPNVKIKIASRAVRVQMNAAALAFFGYRRDGVPRQDFFIHVAIIDDAMLRLTRVPEHGQSTAKVSPVGQFSMAGLRQFFGDEPGSFRLELEPLAEGAMAAPLTGELKRRLFAQLASVPNGEKWVAA